MQCVINFIYVCMYVCMYVSYLRRPFVATHIVGITNKNGRN